MRKGKRFGVRAEVVLDEVRGEVADGVSADPRSDERHLLHVSGLGGDLLAEVGQQRRQGLVELAGELPSQPVPGVAVHDKSKPVLLDLGEPVPGIDEPRQESGAGLGLQESQILNDRLVQSLVLGFVAVEQQEWVDKHG